MAIRVLLALLLLFVLFVMPAYAQDEYVRVTFYTIRGYMRWGNYTHLGAAACGSYFPPGTQLQFDDEFVVTCEDTGYIGRAQVDVWVPSYNWGIENIEKSYGTYTWVTVLRWGYGTNN